MTKHIAIIGAGWAGLSAAVSLAEAGYRVSVYEAGKVLGGRARRVLHAGDDLDNGQHLLLGAYRQTLAMTAKVGLASDDLFLRTPLHLSYPADGVSLRVPNAPAPFHLIFGLLSAKGFSWQEKISTTFFVRALMRQNWQVPKHLSVAALLSQHQQSKKLCSFLWEPLCLSALNTKPDQASAQSFVGVLSESLGGAKSACDFLFPKQHLSAIFPDAAAAFVRAKGGEIHTACRVASLEEVRADTVMVATAPQHAARLLAAIPETRALAHQLARYRYEPIATLYVWYPESFALPAPMVGLSPTYEREPLFGHWVFDRGQTHGEAGLMAFVMSTGGAWEGENEVALLAHLHLRLEKTLRHKLPLPHRHFLIIERRATFADTCDRPRPTFQTPLPWLLLAGDYTDPHYPATLEGAVRSGLLAADAVRQMLL